MSSTADESFDFSKLPLEMRSCEVLREEVMRAHDQLIQKSAREKEELLQENSRLSTGAVCSV